MNKPEGMIRLSVLAAENGLRRQTLLRRLRRLDRRIAKDSPTGPFVLSGGGERSATLVDAHVLYLHARGYLHNRLRKEPLQEIRDLLLEMREDQLAEMRQLVEVAQDVTAVRLSVAG